MIAEDRQGVRGQGTGRAVDDAGQQLAGDLVHIGDHQQQTLGCGVGGGQSTGGQRAVDSTGSTCLRLHLNNLDSVAKDVLPTGSGPLIHIVGHGAGGGNGVDASNLSKGIADVSGSSIAVHGLKFSCQNEIPPKVFKFRRKYHTTFAKVCKGVKSFRR